jgi:N-terminal acetyltransferase B complex non-catalytic subunit
MHTTNENAGPDKFEFERKSLVLRIIYLSMQAASPAPKENKETTNGGGSSATLADELGSLLERYARSIGFSFNDAIDAILSISTAEKSFKVSLSHTHTYTHREPQRGICSLSGDICL